MEIFTFMRMGSAMARIDVELVTNPGQDEAEAREELMAQLATFDAAEAQCFKPEDRQKLLAVIEAGFGNFEDFNKDVRGVFASRRQLSIASPRSSRVQHGGSVTVSADGSFEFEDVPDEMRQVLESINKQKVLAGERQSSPADVVALVAATEEELSGTPMPEETAPRRRKGSKTSMGVACQVAPEAEGGQQSDLVPPQPRSRKGSKVKMAMNCEEMVGLVATTPEMVEIVSPSTGNSGAGGVQQHDTRTS